MCSWSMCVPVHLQLCNMTYGQQLETYSVH